MTRKWYPETTLKFMKLYYQRDCLWNMKCEEYKSKSARDAALAEIVEAMGREGFSVADARQKIQGFRNTYSQELNKIERLQRLQGRKYKPSLVWFSIMEDIMAINQGKAVKKDVESQPEKSSGETEKTKDDHGSEISINEPVTKDVKSKESESPIKAPSEESSKSPVNDLNKDPFESPINDLNKTKESSESSIKDSNKEFSESVINDLNKDPFESPINDLNKTKESSESSIKDSNKEFSESIINDLNKDPSESPINDLNKESFKSPINDSNMEPSESVTVGILNVSPESPTDDAHTKSPESPINDSQKNELPLIESDSLCNGDESSDNHKKVSSKAKRTKKQISGKVKKIKNH